MRTQAHRVGTRPASHRSHRKRCIRMARRGLSTTSRTGTTRGKATTNRRQHRSGRHLRHNLNTNNESEQDDTEDEMTHGRILARDYRGARARPATIAHLHAHGAERTHTLTLSYTVTATRAQYQTTPRPRGPRSGHEQHSPTFDVESRGGGSDMRETAQHEVVGDRP